MRLRKRRNEEGGPKKRRFRIDYEEIRHNREEGQAVDFTVRVYELLDFRAKPSQIDYQGLQRLIDKRALAFQDSRKPKLTDTEIATIQAFEHLADPSYLVTAEDRKRYHDFRNTRDQLFTDRFMFWADPIGFGTAVLAIAVSLGIATYNYYNSSSLPSQDKYVQTDQQLGDHPS